MQKERKKTEFWTTKQFWTIFQHKSICEEDGSSDSVKRRRERGETREEKRDVVSMFMDLWKKEERRKY